MVILLIKMDPTHLNLFTLYAHYLLVHIPFIWNAVYFHIFYHKLACLTCDSIISINQVMAIVELESCM
jgi:hypothetical protein